MSLLSAITTFLPARPMMEVDALGPTVQLFVLPGSQLRRLPRSGAFVAFSDSTGWLAHGTMLAIKDKADYRLDDQIRALAPIAPGHVVSLPAKAIPAKHLIVANIYNDRKIATPESFARAFDAAVAETVRLGEKSAIFPDPTPDWNYNERRTGSDLAARMFIASIVRNRKNLKMFRILVTLTEYADQYAKALGDLNENSWKFYDAAVAQG